jgi:hypothetical protein
VAIVLIIVGVLIVALTDRLQPDAYRKPTLNRYLGYLGGIVWLLGVVLAFVNYKLLHAILLLVASFILGGIIGVKPNK